VEKWANIEIIEGADHNLNGAEISLLKIVEDMLLS
jgi:hypothetical protein